MFLDRQPEIASPSVFGSSDALLGFPGGDFRDRGLESRHDLVAHAAPQNLVRRTLWQLGPDFDLLGTAYNWRAAPGRSPISPRRSAPVALRRPHASRSPHFSSGRPTTAASTTPSKPNRTSSSLTRIPRCTHPKSKQVVLAIDEIEKTVIVHVAEVAGVQPAVAKDLGRGVRVVPIARHCLRAATHDLAALRRRAAGDPARRTPPPRRS